MSEYKPGTVAVATVRGVKNVRVMLDVDGEWLSATIVGGYQFHRDENVTDIRPQVLLDVAEMYDGVGMGGWEYVIRALRDRSYRAVFTREDIADQIEAQIRPPRIPEPGLWGVVRDSHGYEYVRVGRLSDAPWQVLGVAAAEKDRYHRWGDIEDPVLVRKGVDDE